MAQHVNHLTSIYISGYTGMVCLSLEFRRLPFHCLKSYSNPEIILCKLILPLPQIWLHFKVSECLPNLGLAAYLSEPNTEAKWWVKGRFPY